MSSEDREKEPYTSSALRHTLRAVETRKWEVMAEPSQVSEVSAADAVAHGGASFPIVAVGASAGGLAPTVELLHEVGVQPGIALVVIHHLDPTHESGLVEILSRATPMPVAQATEGVRVRPNHVYVIPPNAELLIR